MDITTLGVTEMRKKLADGSLSSADMVAACKKKYEDDSRSDMPLNGYIEFYDDALDAARAADAELQSARDRAELMKKKPLLGVPFALKDNISVKGKLCTCGSRILAGYRAPYDATVTRRLLDAGAVPVGRTNMDEFAMGSSTEYSSYGPTRNPVDRSLSPGGSSGGSAAVVADGQVPFALGTETGGSVRLPASYCGVYGLKPTYGVLSRWGVVAFGSSLDQVGIFGRTPEDIAVPLSVLAGEDPYDDTSASLDTAGLVHLKAADIRGLKVAIPKQFLSAKGLDSRVSAVFEDARKWFIDQGAVVETVDIPVLEAAIASYYVIALSEAASNLSRFDGIRYGLRKDPGTGYDDLYVATRSDGFGAEVKRRIVIGNYVLSSNFSGDCYKKAMSVRARIQRDVSAVLKTRDVIFCPTSPAPAFKLGERVDDPLAMYLSDLFTTFVNLARIPAISMPGGRTPEGLPVGIQIAGPHFSETRILEIASAWENSRRAAGGAK